MSGFYWLRRGDMLRVLTDQELADQQKHEREMQASITALDDENAKLRELVRRYSEYVDQDRCEGCVYKSRCNEGYIEECWQLTEIRELARELEMENGD